MSRLHSDTASVRVPYAYWTTETAVGTVGLYLTGILNVDGTATG